MGQPSLLLLSPLPMPPTYYDHLHHVPTTDFPKLSSLRVALSNRLLSSLLLLNFPHIHARTCTHIHACALFLPFLPPFLSVSRFVLRNSLPSSSAQSLSSLFLSLGFVPLTPPSPFALFYSLIPRADLRVVLFPLRVNDTKRVNLSRLKGFLPWRSGPQIVGDFNENLIRCHAYLWLLIGIRFRIQNKNF